MNKWLVRIFTAFMPSKEMRRAFRVKYLRDLSNKIIIVRSDGTEKEVNSVSGLTVEFYGKNSVVKIHEPIKFVDSILRLGNNNFVEIQNSKHCIISFVLPYPMRENSKLLIGKDFSCMDCRVFMHDEPNINVTIGDDCMFSFGIIIWPSDGHSIIDEKSKKALNKGENIIIGNHVWLGMNTTILKGSVIPDNSVVAAKAVFAKGSNPLKARILPIFFGGGYSQVCLLNCLKPILIGIEKIIMIIQMYIITQIAKEKINDKYYNSYGGCRFKICQSRI